MPNFKPKANRKIKSNSKDNITLDNKHNEFVNKFKKIETEIIPELQKKKVKLKEQLKTTKLLEEQLEIVDKIKKIKREIIELQSAQKNYYLNNSKYIFQYFENKEEICNDNNNKKSLDSFFKLNTTKNKKVETTNLEKYLENINESFLDINNYIQKEDVCSKCHKGEMIPIDHEGVMLCNNCSIQTNTLIENEKPSYKEPPKEVCFYAYKRINHFREILAQFQAKETTQIPTEVIENIKLQIKKERITLEQFTNKKAKDILKKLGYNKYYEHIPFIKDKLGIKPPIMSVELEEKLCNLFMDIQQPYSKFCPNDRVNFLNYYYTVYKLCELLEKDEFLPFFPMLKDREKIIEQDEVWKKICNELNWQFIATI